MNGEEVVRTYSDMIYKIAYRYVHNQYDAEDILSETLLNYFKKEREFESEEHRKAWLIRVAINESKNVLSKTHYDEEINEELLGGEDEWSGITDAMDLKSAIQKLPEHQREVILLYYMQNLSVNEVADMLGKNKNTVAVTLARARENLRKYLES
ncbi:MAG: sigma-70 family RNA polymerase sigma factor [Clostridia bacterium]|nr:sigma-70 family RNA polymerase sigma factor [Clostridia bacterium]